MRRAPVTEPARELQRAYQMYQTGRLADAEALLARLRRVLPANGDVLHLLGIIAYQTGRTEEAASLLRDSCRLLNDSPQVMNSLGVVLLESGDIQAAIATLRRAIELKADFSQAHNNLGNALRKAGRAEEAIAAYSRSIQIDPGNVEVLDNVGDAFMDQGRVDDAIASYRKALAANPAHAGSHRRLGDALKNGGHLDEAIKAYERAIELKPDFVEARNDLGNLFKDTGRSEEAVREYEQAISLRPGCAEACCNLGNIYRERGLTGKAIESYRRALQTKPDFAEVVSNLGNAFKDQGDLEAATAAYRKALELKPSLADARSNLVYARQFTPGVTLAQVLQDHLEWNDIHVSSLRNGRIPHLPGLGLPRSLVLGFVSGDFRKHPVGSFLVRIFEGLAGMDCRIVCYANQIENDDMTDRFRKAAHLWRDCRHLSDSALADVVRRDRVDILFDLSGHNERNRLLVFGRRPAPLQITWAGYMATTGVETMDYIIADRHEIPEGSERYYTEKVIRMPHSFVCYDPPEYAPPVRSLPALANGHITFGSFNILFKVSPEVVGLWSSILHRIAGSRLVLKTKELNAEETRRRYADLFSRCGIGPERVDLIGGTPHREHLDYYNRIDIALDPFPFSGSTTTLESLWMGVPVVTMPGETFAGRHSLSFLSTVGLTGTIADSPGRYLEIAERLSGDLAGLAEMRSNLRDRFRESPLCDGDAFAGALLAALSHLREEETKAFS